jgi:8-oxo-dGTP pyrophosphatase MutT (NUDIX family)
MRSCLDTKQLVLVVDDPRGVFMAETFIECKQDDAALLRLAQVDGREPDGLKKKPVPARRIGTCCMIFCCNCVLLGWHKQRQGWEFPGGALEGDEEVTTTIRREVQEETSIELPPALSFEGYDDSQPGWLNMMFSSRLGSFIDVGVFEHNAHREWQWFPCARLPRPLNIIAESVVKTGVFSRASLKQRE